MAALHPSGVSPAEASGGGAAAAGSGGAAAGPLDILVHALGAGAEEVQQAHAALRSLGEMLGCGTVGPRSTRAGAVALFWQALLCVAPRQQQQTTHG